MKESRAMLKKYKSVNTGEVALPVCFSHTEGSYIYDADGKKYLDFTSGYGVTNSGWLRKEITDAIQDQLQKSAFAPPWLPSGEAIELSELLLSIVPGNLVKCARAIGGADANEIIHKAVIAATGKKEIVSFYRSYHGGTHFTLNISDSMSFRLPDLPSGKEFHFVDPPYCYRCPFGKCPDSCNLECTTAIEKLFQNKNIGCFFAEPVLGSGGVIIPSQKYWRRIRELCTQYNVFLVFDEVLTGFGRTGTITASEVFGINPDAISFAKGMSSGYTAIGAAILNAELSEALKKFEDVSATFAWTPLSCTAAKKNIELILKEELPHNASAMGETLLRKLNQLFQKYLPMNTGEIRGMGLMIGIELVENIITKIPDQKLMRKILITAFRKGLMICASWDFQALVIMPPLNISEREVEEGIKIIEDTLKELAILPVHSIEQELPNPIITI
ncbi:MAG: aspartate aminotransferase family protein [Bacteroidetes bacterium]|nr:aspartate aminotransferase family protein [Bacteroidota bacterium]MBS1930098.1 aspartate aminotransferase family protein [Bacteroidota bacterium]